MTNRPVREPAPRPIRSVGGDAGGPGAGTISFAPILAFVGLLLVAVLSFSLLTLSSSAASGPEQSNAPGATNDPGTGPGPGRPTPNPSVVVTPPPQDRVTVRGTILFVRTGNIWSVSGESLTEISNKGTDSWPIWAPDGKHIYFTETRTKVAQAPYQGRDSKYTLYYPVLMSMNPDGSNRQEVYNSLYKLGGGADRMYFMQVQQAAISPDGTTFALVSDAPDPFSRNVTLSTLPATGGKITNLGVQQVAPVGHNDPDWSPDGKQIAFSYNGKNGPIGAPRIGVYTVATKKLKFVGNRGFANPDWSPDGRHFAVEQTDGKGRDIAILDASTGALVDTLTPDGDSFAPVWAPDGTQIAYLRIKGQAVDLRIMTLKDDGSLQVASDKAITEDGSIDARSGPAWYFPPDLRPAIPTPGASSAPATSPSSSPSTRPSASTP
jgi:Tol biopolymer transport system component